MTNDPSSGFSEADYRARRVLLERQIAEAEQHLAAAQFDEAFGLASGPTKAIEQHADDLRSYLTVIDAAWLARGRLA
jgi:hypothetical protein